jgi:hypothetical protein
MTNSSLVYGVPVFANRRAIPATNSQENTLYYGQEEDTTLRLLDHDSVKQAQAKIKMIQWVLEANLEAVIMPDIVLRKVWLAMRGVDVEQLLAEVDD